MESQTLKTWIGLTAKGVEVQVIVTADGFKTMADEVGLPHQVCKAHDIELVAVPSVAFETVRL